MDTSFTSAICLSLPLITVTVGYLVLARFKPFKRCRKCHGAGIQRLMLGRTRICRRCNATGHVLRFGFRASNYLTRVGNELGKGRR